MIDKRTNKKFIEFLDGEIKETKKEYGKYLLTGTTNRKIALLTEIKGIVEDYPRIKEMLNNFIREEVNEYKNMR